MHVQLGQAQRQTRRVWIVLVVIGFSLRAQFRGPRGHRRKLLLKARADIEELRHRRIVRRGRNRKRQGPRSVERFAAAAPTARAPRWFPQTRKVGLAVRGPGWWRR